MSSYFFSSPVSNLNFLDISFNAVSTNAPSSCFTSNNDVSNDYVTNSREESFDMQTETQKFECFQSEYDKTNYNFVELYLIIYVGINFSDNSSSSYTFKDLSLSTSFTDSFHVKERDDRHNIEFHTIETSSEIQHINSNYLDVSRCSKDSTILCSPATNSDSLSDFQTPSKGFFFSMCYFFNVFNVLRLRFVYRLADNRACKKGHLKFHNIQSIVQMSRSFVITRKFNTRSTLSHSDDEI